MSELLEKLFLHQTFAAVAAPLFGSRDEAIFNKCPYYNAVETRLAYALEVVNEFEVAVDDNIERTNLIEPFLDLPNNRSKPDLS